ncbi:ATP-binding protein [Bordetella bronchialis]|uniref:ATP-binding protein n=1 Tax=Bordetella bronchialis TaxID=463025 RepID=UPI003CFC065D
MAINLSTLRRVKNDRPPIICVHGGPGIGKTTFAASSEDCVFIRTEDGLGVLEVDAFPISTSFDEVMEAISSLASEEHNFKWLVLDSLSALEPLIWAAVAKDEGKKNVEDIPYGKAYVIALDRWREMLDALAYLAAEKKVGSILIAHSDIVRHEPPEMAAYDRTQIKLHKRAFQLVYERADIIGYAAPEVFLSKDGDPKSLKGARNIATGSGQRWLHLVEKPAFIAKNRYQLPEKLPLSWADFHAELMARLAAPTGQAGQSDTTEPAAKAA